MVVEQANIDIKFNGRVIGLTIDPSWFVLRLQAYEKTLVAKNEAQLRRIVIRHKRLKGYLLRGVKKLTIVIQEFGNPFQKGSDDLLILDTREIAESIAKHNDKVQKCTSELCIHEST